MHRMSVPNCVWSCAVSTVVYFRNRTFSRAVGPSSGVPLTLLTSVRPDASKFCVFGCTDFAKVLDNLRRKLADKVFCGIMVDYPFDYTHGYPPYNHVTRRTTTSVHFMFHEDTPVFGASSTNDSLIMETPTATSGLDKFHIACTCVGHS
jgi:hypothetical protein